jgi:16S rRNA (guanine527-N7)-methyltransferase
MARKVESLPRIDGPDSFCRVFQVSRETLSRLECHVAEVERWQKTINLVAPSTLQEIWRRHVADSAQLLRLVPPDARTFADLGSGGGFPGLVLAILIAGRRGPADRFMLVESDQRKAAFLREAARQCGIAVEIVSTRIESRETHARVGRVDVVTARALAPLSRLLRLAVPLFGPTTTGLFPKGRGVAEEVETARRDFAFEVVLEPSMTDAEGAIAVIRGLSAKTEA